MTESIPPSWDRCEEAPERANLVGHEMVYLDRETRRRFREFLTIFERLGTWRTRSLSGHFVAIVADRQ